MIRPVSFREILDAPNAKDLFREYAAEYSLPELGEIQPQAHLYLAMEAGGGMQALGVYRGTTLIGFATVLTYVLPDYGKTVAATESIFIAAAHRQGSIGLELIDFLEKYACSRGCAALLYTAPTGSTFEKLLALRKDCRRTNSVFLRNLT